ncbi:similar to Saccharomyces cerevisiae YMR179W SPT21 Protein with a role in transcriptional silencing [Maudiozyma saulgeensis]|uniref:Similar to Saccharomyces cerevisiae YMR179W SPT21 Protein with a role in transcriptional silencing n=1 Tax=Maudiozyma saulgeensis TaxID=1789683 RepID=A0A1X7R0B8_9SACH|nr:similar to Saccharomyces cerevisiae YMR179W SPT21 Protein with a role in transcriptional silencing [Kazachstania saulgeensis]
MAEVSRMTLKILYSLDDGTSGSYLARSKKPHEVRVANIPNPSSPTDSELKLRIGAVNLSFVLDEIQLNSPEVMEIYTNRPSINNDVVMDYNLYYHDICEANEPLVSLGLLSKIRSNLQKQTQDKLTTINEDTTPEDDGDEELDEYDDEFMVIGRVCSNFSAMLRRTYSNASKKRKQNKNDENNSESVATPETLEVKLKLKRVVTNRPKEMPEIPKVSTPSVKPQRYAPPTITTVAKSVRVNKRQTNPKPAPKAIRTQSLPIWDTRLNPAGSGFMKTSIAHKIYMADRQTENLGKQQQQQQKQESHPDALTYEINSLQPDNSVQKIKVDDAISKRFDFMNKKKDTATNNITIMKHSTASTKKSTKKVTKASRTKSGKILPTMATMQISQTVPSPLTTIANGLSETITGKTPCDEDDDIITSANNNNNNNSSSNKENIPPPIDNENISRDMYTNLLNFNENSIDWLNEFNDATKGLDLVGMMEPPSNTTPMAMTNLTNSKNTPRDIPTVEDMDRTSPIDTLSMPLMELDQAGKIHNIRNNEKSIENGTLTNMRKKSTGGSTKSKVTTCHDQLRRLPLLSGQQKEFIDIASAMPADVTVPNSDATVLVSYSKSEDEGNEEDEEEDESSNKRHGIMPSSPGMMFGYKPTLNEDEDEENDDYEGDDIFSSFVNGSNDGVSHDTPATNNCSSDPK